MVADHLAGEGGEDRRQGRGPRPFTSCSRWPRSRCPASCSAASSTGSGGCARRTWLHADARWAGRRGTGCRDAPGVRPWGAQVKPEVPRRGPGSPWRAARGRPPSPGTENPCLRGHEGGIQAPKTGTGPRSSGKCPLRLSQGDSRHEVALLRWVDPRNRLGSAG